LRGVDGVVHLVVGDFDVVDVGECVDVFGCLDYFGDDGCLCEVV